MIYLKPRHPDCPAKHKCAKRIYEGGSRFGAVTGRRWTRVNERRQLLSPRPANEVWSMDVVFTSKA